MPDTYVDAEVEVEVDSTELEVEAGDEESFEAELTAPGLEIEVEAEIQVAGEPDYSDEDAELSDEQSRDSEGGEEHVAPEGDE